MKVYLAMANYDYDGNFVMRVCSTEEKARYFIVAGKEHRKLEPVFDEDTKNLNGMHERVSIHAEKLKKHRDLYPEGFRPAADSYEVEEYEVE